MSKMEQEVPSLFPEHIVSTLEDCQSQLDAGQGFEVANTRELLAKIEQSGTIRASSWAA